jgi:hypothetical protein
VQDGVPDRGPDEGPNPVPDGGPNEAKRGAQQTEGQTTCLTGARHGPNRPGRVPDGDRRGVQRGQTGWRTEGLFTFKRKKRHVLYTCHVNHLQHPTCPTPGGCEKS